MSKASLYLFSSVLLLGCHSEKRTNTSENQRIAPNVLIIRTDQWRAQATGYAGDPNISTPHLDNLAAKGKHYVKDVLMSDVTDNDTINRE